MFVTLAHGFFIYEFRTTVPTVKTNPCHQQPVHFGYSSKTGVFGVVVFPMVMFYLFVLIFTPGS